MVGEVTNPKFANTAKKDLEYQKIKHLWGPMTP